MINGPGGCSLDRPTPADRACQMTRDLPSPETLRKLLRYEPETGLLFWRARPVTDFPNLRIANAWNSRWAEKEALSNVNDAGYRRGAILWVTCRAHRVIWAMQTGEWPMFEIDHQDKDRANNRWVNLREATRSENEMNKGQRADSRSGVKGVRWKAEKSKWQARIRLLGKETHLGYFDDIDAARSAYAKASAAMHGAFGRVA